MCSYFVAMAVAVYTYALAYQAGDQVSGQLLIQLLPVSGQQNIVESLVAFWEASRSQTVGSTVQRSIEQRDLSKFNGLACELR